MPNSLRTMIKKLRYKGKIDGAECEALLTKLKNHDEIIRKQGYTIGFNNGCKMSVDEDNKAIFYNDSTLKLRSGDYVLYKVDWLKEHFQQEMDILGVGENEDDN